MRGGGGPVPSSQGNALSWPVQEDQPGSESGENAAHAAMQKRKREGRSHGAKLKSVAEARGLQEREKSGDRQAPVPSEHLGQQEGLASRKERTEGGLTGRSKTGADDQQVTHGQEHTTPWAAGRRFPEQQEAVGQASVPHPQPCQ